MKPFGPAAKLNESQILEYFARVDFEVKRSGSQLVAPCPLHGGKHDNLKFSAKTGQYKCFSKCEGDRKTGDIYSFHQRFRGLSSIGDAIREVYELLGLAGNNGHNGADVKKGRPPRKADTAASERNDIADKAAAKLAAAGTESKKEADFVEVKRTDYLYHDAAGVEVYFIRRIDKVERLNPENKDKDFWAYRHKGKGEVKGLGGVAVVPYRLPDLLTAVEVFVVEGEKCVEAMREVGFAATCNPFGGDNWPSDFGQYFGGRLVRVLPDNDQKGRKHTAAVVANLLPVAREVKVVKLPGLSERGDIVNWLAAGGTAEQLRALVEAAEVVKLPAAAVPEGVRELSKNTLAELADQKLSELGLAGVALQQFGADIRHVSELRSWFKWNGLHWDQSKKQEVKAAFITTVEELAGKSCRTHGKISGAMELAAADRDVALAFGEFDTHDDVLNFRNGTLDLRTGELRSHSRGDLISKLIPFDYVPEAKAPRWERFLQEIFKGQPDELLEWIQRAFGYTLTGDVTEHCFFFMYGKDGRNGKGTFINTLLKIFGGYGHAADLRAFKVKRDDGPLDAVANFRGARLVVANETQKGVRLDEALMKTLTGGDIVRARLLNQNSFEMRPTWKIWISGNNKPEVSGTDLALWERVRLIPFVERFVGARKNKQLPEQLMREAEGIIVWAVEGALRWREEGLEPVPEVVQLATDAYQMESDPIGQFFKMWVEYGDAFSVAGADLFGKYKQWAVAGEKRIIRIQDFAEDVAERSGIIRIRGGRGTTYHGIRLLETPRPEKETAKADANG